MRVSIGIVLSCLLGLAFTSIAQTRPSGEYMLTGVMETAAGFRLNPDQTFDYIFVYGAADKWGKGTWKQNESTLILNSNDKEPVHDFILKSADASFKNGIKIVVTDPQKQPYPYVEMRVGGENGETVSTDQKGEAFLKKTGNGLLEIYHPIYSTHITTIKLNPKQTNFTIHVAGDLSQVYFSHFLIQVSPDKLTTKSLPGMPLQDAGGQKSSYVFEKVK